MSFPHSSQLKTDLLSHNSFCLMIERIHLACRWMLPVRMPRRIIASEEKILLQLMRNAEVPSLRQRRERNRSITTPTSSCHTSMISGLRPAHVSHLESSYIFHRAIQTNGKTRVRGLHHCRKSTFTTVKANNTKPLIACLAYKAFDEAGTVFEHIRQVVPSVVGLELSHHKHIVTPLVVPRGDLNVCIVTRQAQF